MTLRLKIRRYGSSKQLGITLPKVIADLEQIGSGDYVIFYQDELRRWCIRFEKVRQ